MSSQLSRALPLFPLPPGCVTLFILFPYGKNRRCPCTEDQYQVTQACGTWQTACFLALSFFFLLSPSFSCVDVLKVLVLLDFYSFPFFIVCAYFCKVSCSHCVICCIKCLQRSIRGSFNTKRLGMTDDNAIFNLQELVISLGKPLNGT